MLLSMYGKLKFTLVLLPCFNAPIKSIFARRMRISLFILNLCILFCCSNNLCAQDSTISIPQPKPEPVINIDSLIRDSLNKIFILNHKPLSADEKKKIIFQKEPSAYGQYVKVYLSNVKWYPFGIPDKMLVSTKRTRLNLEWIFYTFLFLFLFTAVIGRYSNGLLNRLFKIYANDGFIHRQSKDQLAQQPLVIFSLNLLFVFTLGLFVFFGLGWDHQYTGLLRWGILTSCFVAIALLYFFKQIIFKILGWAFGQEEAFQDYLFVVFLNNKLIGLICLFASFLMSFSGQATSVFIFNFILFVIGIMMGYRFVRGYLVFSKHARAGFFTLLLGFISLEVLPTALILKFIFKSVEQYISVLS